MDFLYTRNNKKYTEMNNEVWLPVKGFEASYLVSNKGRIKTIKTGRIRKLVIKPFGYLEVSLSLSGRCRSKLVHRLVAFAFLDKQHPLYGQDVNHINGSKTDNAANNLEWANDFLNMQHAFKNKLVVRHKGDKHPMSKLTNKDVEFIKQYPKGRGTGIYLANKFSVIPATICHIRKNRNWKFLNISTH